MSLRPSSRNRSDGVLNPRYDVGGKSINKLYYDPARTSAFSTPRKLRSATVARARKKSGDVIRAWLKKQDTYRLHRLVRKRFARNPYTVSNVMDVWECDLFDVPTHANFNDNYRYILSVIDVFSKYLHMIPIKTKSGTVVALAFRYIR